MGWADYLSDLEPSDIVDFPQWLMGATRPSWEGRPQIGSPWSEENWQHSANWTQEQLEANPMAFMGGIKPMRSTPGVQYIRDLIMNPFTGKPAGGSINAMSGNRLLGELNFTGSDAGGFGLQNLMSYAKGSGVGSGMIDEALDLARQHGMPARLGTPIAPASKSFWQKIADNYVTEVPDFANEIWNRLR
jgi:hypothetical protein